MSRTRNVLVAGIAGCMLAGSAAAGATWDEAIDGSLSTDRFNTTDLETLSAGSNDVLGTTVIGISKFFAIMIGEGDNWAGLIAESRESNDDLGFLAVREGERFSGDPNDAEISRFMGYVHSGAFDVGPDILPAMGQGLGSYNSWVQETGPSAVEWDLNGTVYSSQTPVPGIGGLAGLMGLGLIRRRRR